MFAHCTTPFTRTRLLAASMASTRCGGVPGCGGKWMFLHCVHCLACAVSESGRHRGKETAHTTVPLPCTTLTKRQTFDNRPNPTTLRTVSRLWGSGVVRLAVGSPLVAQCTHFRRVLRLLRLGCRETQEAGIGSNHRVVVRTTRQLQQSGKRLWDSGEKVGKGGLLGRRVRL